MLDPTAQAGGASDPPVERDRLIWATRGRYWGSRFLRPGELEDPLPVYDTAFSGVEDRPEAWGRVAKTVELPEMVALRFPDPLKRQDAAGRIIPHEFVVFGPEADEIGSVEDGRRMVRHLVAEEFARIWELPKPTSPTE